MKIVKLVKRNDVWQKLQADNLKFNIVMVSRRNLGETVIRGTLRDANGDIMALFSKAIGIIDSNLAELLAIKEAIPIFVAFTWSTTHKLKL